MGDARIVVLVHGWSVHNTDAYGELPDRLQAEAEAQAGLKIDIHNIWLGRYVSFRDEVHLEDISRAFESALRQQLGPELAAGRKIVVITHSTGGPVVRDWWHRFYMRANQLEACPLSHLIMLAPANFGSALAQLGKGTLSRLSSLVQGVEPGQGVLDWLELGSPESIELNLEWIRSGEPWRLPNPMYPFVLTGQSIDRAMYDHVNSYTGESGSDGVVRVASANLNATYVRLEQDTKELVDGSSSGHPEASGLKLKELIHAPRAALAVLPRLSHSGEKMGILRSIGATGKHDTVSAILKCLLVNSAVDYEATRDDFANLTKKTQQDELIEPHGHILLPDTYTIHERRTMIIVRVRDDSGYELDDFDFLLLGRGSSPDRLPPGFFVDRQQNQRRRGTLTYFLNHDVLTNSDPIVFVHQENGKEEKKVLRPALPGANEMGFRVNARPKEGFVHYLDAIRMAHGSALDEFLCPNATLLLDIVLHRFVGSGTFTLTQDRTAQDFRQVPVGDEINPSG